MVFTPSPSLVDLVPRHWLRGLAARLLRPLAKRHGERVQREAEALRDEIGALEERLSELQDLVFALRDQLPGDKP